MKGGPIAAVREGDTIVIDVEQRRIDVDLADEMIRARLTDVAAPPPRHTTGALAKYAALVSPASEGAVTRPL
jgi:dihydroxy-acid dehydratase